MNLRSQTYIQHSLIVAYIDAFYISPQKKISFNG